MNNDYISRQTAIDWFMHYLHLEENIPPDVVISDLRKLPVADVRPVVYGEWEEIRDPYGKIEGWLCKCGNESKSKTNFCPHCGADMRGKPDGTP